MGTHRALLFTGGEWHNFKTGAEILIAALKPFGFDVTHTEDPSVMSKLSGGNFDAVVLYSQGDRFNEEQIAGIDKFVKGGGGLVGVHCASDTNRTSSPAFMKLLGCAFKSHHPGTIDFQV